MGLHAGDPLRAGGPPVGKTKRIRQVLVYATDHNPNAGLDLARQVVALLRADSAFIPALDINSGAGKVAVLG